MKRISATLGILALLALAACSKSETAAEPPASASVPVASTSLAPEDAAQTFLEALNGDDDELAATVATRKALDEARAFGAGPWELDEDVFTDVDSACRANSSDGYDCVVAGPGDSYFYLLLSEAAQGWQVTAATLGD